MHGGRRSRLDQSLFLGSIEFPTFQLEHLCLDGIEYVGVYGSRDDEPGVVGAGLAVIREAQVVQFFHQPFEYWHLPRSAPLTFHRAQESQA